MEKLYHYTMCGLDNVYLENGYRLSETSYGTAVEIEDSERLDRAIAFAILDGNVPLAGKEIRFVRQLIGMSQNDFGREWFGKDAQTIARWEKDHTPIPQAEETVLRIYAKTYLGGGDETLMRAVSAINFIDRVRHQKIVVSEVDGEWSPSVQDEDQLQEICTG